MPPRRQRGTSTPRRNPPRRGRVEQTPPTPPREDPLVSDVGSHEPIPSAPEPSVTLQPPTAPTVSPSQQQFLTELYQTFMAVLNAVAAQIQGGQTPPAAPPPPSVPASMTPTDPRIAKGKAPALNVSKRKSGGFHSAQPFKRSKGIAISSGDSFAGSVRSSFQQQQRPVRPIGSTEMMRRSAGNRCRNCQKYHSGPYREPVRCFRCGQTGHIRSGCPEAGI